MTHFERLGIPSRFSVDAAVIEENYLARSRETHPDFHGTSSEADQRGRIEESAALNEAYVTLCDPMRRADYLVTLLGGPTARDEKNLDQSFLMEMMDLRERIEETRAARKDLSTLEADLNARLQSVFDRIAVLFGAMDSSEPTVSKERLVQIRRLLNASKTLRSLLRDVRETGVED